MKRKAALILALTIFMQLGANVYAEDYFDGMDSIIDSIYTFDIGDFAADTEDEAMKEFADDIELVCSLGLMSKNDSGNFEGSASLSNRDFFRTIYILKCGEDYVSENIIDGNVTFRQALTAVISVLGYDWKKAMYESEDAWLNGCTYELGLSKGLSITLDKTIQRQEFAKLLVNSFNVDISAFTSFSSNSIFYNVQDGVNILMDKLDIYKIRGCINAVPGLNIYSDNTPGEDEVEIDRVRFKMGNSTNVYDMLGESVEAYVKFDDKSGANILLYCKKNSNSKSVHFTIDDLGNYSSDSLYYYDGQKEVKVKTSGLKHILYNGDIKTDISILNDAEGKSGNISLYDTNGDGFDTMIVNAYTSFLVDGVDTYENRLRLSYGAQYDGKSYIDLNKLDNVLIKVDGIKVNDYTAIQTKMVVSVIQNSRKSYTEILASSKTITGRVESFLSSENTVVIDDSKIKIDNGYIEISKMNSAEVTKISLGSTGTFYISALGYIAGFRDANEKVHAYLKRAYVSDDDDETVKMRVFTEDGKWENVALKNNVNIDGTKLDSAAFVSYVQANDLQGTLIAYNVNNNNEAKEIDTIIFGSGEEKSTSMNLDFEVLATLNWTGLWSVPNSSYHADEKTVVFNVPENGEEKKFSIIAYNSPAENASCKVQYYNSDDFLIAKYVVYSGASKSLQIGSNEILVTRIYAAYVDDEICYKINAIQFIGISKGNGYCEELEFTVSEDVMEEYSIVQGGVYSIGTDSEGSITAAEQLYDTSKTEDYKIASNNSTQHEYLLGTVVKVDPTSKMVIVSCNGQQSSWCMRAVAIYNTSDGKSRVAAPSDIYAGDRIFISGNVGHSKVNLIIR